MKLGKCILCNKDEMDEVLIEYNAVNQGLCTKCNTKYPAQSYVIELPPKEKSLQEQLKERKKKNDQIF